MLFNKKLKKIKKETTKFIDDLVIEDFNFIIGTQTICIKPIEIAFKKIRKSNGTKIYEVKTINIPKPANTLNNPKILFETSSDNFENFKNEFCDCEEAEIKCFYIKALFANQDKAKFLNSQIDNVRIYGNFYDKFLYDKFIQDLKIGFRFIEYNIPYITDAKEFSKDYEILLFDNIKAYLNEFAHYNNVFKADKGEQTSLFAS